MINLTELEQKIDNLLESETTETLNNWLFQKRFGNAVKLVGNGSFVSLNAQKPVLFSNSQPKVNFTQKDAYSPCNSFHTKAA